jgi:hypothetical protein
MVRDVEDVSMKLQIENDKTKMKFDNFKNDKPMNPN